MSLFSFWSVLQLVSSWKTWKLSVLNWLYSQMMWIFDKGNICYRLNHVDLVLSIIVTVTSCFSLYYVTAGSF